MPIELKADPSAEKEIPTAPPKPDSLNPDEIYHQASRGRLQTTTDESKSYDEIHFISKDVEGSDELERSKQNWRLAESKRLDDNLFPQIVFCTVATVSLGYAFMLYGRFLPIIGTILAITGLISLGFMINYLVRQIKITIASHRYKKRRKNQSPPKK